MACTHLHKPGTHPVNAPVICVIIRFGLSSIRHLLPTYFDYRRVLKQVKATQTPGLLRAAFLIENPRTCYSFSLWTGKDAIPHFGTNVPYHVNAARRVFGRVSFYKKQGPEVWSTRFRLAAVSNNLHWENFDLRQLLWQISE